MKRKCTLFLLCSLFLLLTTGMEAQRKPKVHVVSFGRTMTVKLFLGPDEKRSAPMKIRALYTDSKLADFTTGEVHTITDQLFVVRRVVRINNNLPEEKVVGNWLWQKDGWVIVDKQKAHVTLLTLPYFDPYYSQASWFRDYTAYCGISDNGEKLYAVIMQIGRKKPVFKKILGNASHGDDPVSNCAEPQWERQPVRVSFAPAKGARLDVQVFEHTAGESTAEESSATESDKDEAKPAAAPATAAPVTATPEAKP